MLRVMNRRVGVVKTRKERSRDGKSEKEINFLVPISANVVNTVKRENWNVCLKEVSEIEEIVAGKDMGCE